MARLLHRIVICVLFLFLLAPVVLVLPMSFSADAFLVWPPSGFSTRWYAALARDIGLLKAAGNSLILASAVCAAALAIALPAALGVAVLLIAVAGGMQLNQRVSTYQIAQDALDEAALFAASSSTNDDSQLRSMIETASRG